MRNQKITVSEKEQLADKLFRVRFGFDEELDFIAGQHVSLKVADHARRSYSIANAPSEKWYFETFVDTNPGGPGSIFFEQVQVGDSVHGLFPLGNFIYEENSNPLVFFATGTGIVPFLSMLKHELQQVNSGRDIKLFYGVRHPNQVIEATKLQQLVHEFSNFELEIFATRPDETWEFSTGRITRQLDNPGFHINADFYICGGTAMIEEVESGLLDLGVTPDRIRYERYY